MKMVETDDQKVNETNQGSPEITTNENGNKKPDFSEVSIKEMMAIPAIQESLRRYIAVPDVVTVKKLRKPYQPDGTEHKTQKISVMSGNSIEEAVSFDLTLIDTELGDEAINKKYHIVDYTFALEANMAGGKFGGYAAKGLKLMVSKLERIERTNK